MVWAYYYGVEVLFTKSNKHSIVNCSVFDLQEEYVLGVGSLDIVQIKCQS